jgi:hypothetical protein
MVPSVTKTKDTLEIHYSISLKKPRYNPYMGDEPVGEMDPVD